MMKKTGSPRREFLRNAALAVGGAATPGSLAQTPPAAPPPVAAPSAATPEIHYPRSFTGDHLAMIAFPLGGVAAGSLSLGGRGQLRDWEIFNRPNKGLSACLRVSLHLGAARQRQASGARAGGAHPSAL